jgi:hypothetical protein
MTLEVCDDCALRQWILGVGRSIRVVAPTTPPPGCSKNPMPRGCSLLAATRHFPRRVADYLVDRNGKTFDTVHSNEAG